MYERMLDKSIKPSFDDLMIYCSECGDLWRIIDEWIKNEYVAQTQIRFPYGKNYGWSIKYSKGSKHICDIFAEDNAFTVFLKINNKSFITIQDSLSDYSKKIYEDKYPCGDGGWVRYRITSEKQMEDARKFINAKMKS